MSTQVLKKVPSLYEVRKFITVQKIRPLESNEPV